MSAPVLTAPAAVGAPATAGATSANAQAAGSPGYCKGSDGVTVVVDFTELGGDIVVRCAPGPVKPGYSGLDAIQDAGFTVTGTSRWGLAFVCRIQGRPSAGESLKTDGNPDYHEQCNDTPPTSAYWGYWYARNGGSWTFSSTGPKSRDAIKGGFEGWSFSLNHSSGDAPAPRVAPTRPASSTPSTPSGPSTPSPSTPSGPGPTSGPGAPGTSPSSEGAPSDSGPSSGQGGDGPDSPAGQGSPDQSGRPGVPGGRDGQDDHGTGRDHEPRTTEPSDPATSGAGSDTARVTGELPRETAEDSGSGSKASTLWGVGVLLLLAAGGGLAAWRRSRRA